MNGKIVVSMLVLVTVLTGAAMWYLRVYGLYDDVSEITGPQSLVLTDPDGAEHPLATEGFSGIAAEGVPVSYRACFTVQPGALDLAQPYDKPTPLNGPKWFKCYSARALTADLESGQAQAYLLQSNIHPGIDRVVAVYPDGRAFVWHQLNESAEEKKVIE